MTQPSTHTHTIFLPAGSVDVSVATQGQGRPILILHGGAGPASVLGLAQALATHARAIVPSHPGFEGSPRPDWFASVGDLAMAYLALLDELDLSEVIVVGNSIGGWIAAEMAVRGSPRLAGVVLVNAAGIDAGAGRIVDVSHMSAAERMALAFHAPQRFAGAAPTPARLALMATNQATLHVYGGAPYMHDPALRARLAGIGIPALVAWGESDRIVDLDYGRRYAANIPGAEFAVIESAGHLPQIERLDELTRLIEAFAADLGAQR